MDQIQSWTDGQGVDLVVDFVGGPQFSQVLDATRPQGIVVPVGFMGGTEVTFDIRNFFFGQKQIRGALAGDIEDLRWALDQIKAGRLRPTLDRTLPLKVAAEAHRLVATTSSQEACRYYLGPREVLKEIKGTTQRHA